MGKFKLFFSPQNNPYSKIQYGVIARSCCVFSVCWERRAICKVLKHQKMQEKQFNLPQK